MLPRLIVVGKRAAFQVPLIIEAAFRERGTNMETNPNVVLYMVKGKSLP